MTLIPPELFGVPMIPFGLLSAFVNKKEVRITEFSETGFRFRTAKPCSAPVNIRLAFRQIIRFLKPCLFLSSESFEVDVFLFRRISGERHGKLAVVFGQLQVDIRSIPGQKRMYCRTVDGIFSEHSIFIKIIILLLKGKGGNRKGYF